jgi:hypothetical protein
MMLPSNRRERNTLCHRYMPGSDGDDLLCALLVLLSQKVAGDN